MYSKKRNQPDDHLYPPPSSVPPKRLFHYMQHPNPEAESLSSLDSERSCLMQQKLDAEDISTSVDCKYAVVADCKYAVVAVGKRSCSQPRRRIIDAEDCSKRSRIEYSDASMSGVTHQKDVNSHHAWMPYAESDTISVSRHMGSCDDSVFLNSRSSEIVEICGNESDADNHGIRRNDANKRVSFVSSRVQESRGSMLARQGIGESSMSSISCCGQSRDGSHSNSRTTTFFRRVRDSSKASHTHGRKAEAAGTWSRLVTSEHADRSPQISSAESIHTPFHDADTMYVKGSSLETMQSKAPSYVLSSGRLSLQEETRLGRRLPTIDDDFEEYFSSLML